MLNARLIEGIGSMPFPIHHIEIRLYALALKFFIEFLAFTDWDEGIIFAMEDQKWWAIRRNKCLWLDFMHALIRNVAHETFAGVVLAIHITYLAIIIDHRLYVAGLIHPIPGIELVSAQRRHAGKVAACRFAHDCDPTRINAVLTVMCTEKADGTAHILNRTRILRFSGTAVIHGRHSVAGIGVIQQIWQPDSPIHLNEASAAHPDQQRPWRAVDAILGQNQIQR